MAERLLYKDEFGYIHTFYKVKSGELIGDKDVKRKLYEYEQKEAKGELIRLPCKVKNLIDRVIGHNEIVAIWERRKNKEGRYHILLWRGMAWNIPEEYLNRTFLKIFGTVPESISNADSVNIAVTSILKDTEKALEERENNG